MTKSTAGLEREIRSRPGASERIDAHAIHVNAYRVVAEAVEAGVAYGWNRAHKHTDEPFPEDTRRAIADAVMSELCEWLKFPDFYE